MTTFIVSAGAFMAGLLLGASGLLTWIKGKLPWST